MIFFRNIAFCFLVFLMGFVAHIFMGEALNLELALSYLTSISTIAAAVMACLALSSWRKQLRFSNIYSVATELEYVLTEQLILVSGHEVLEGNEDFGKNGKKIQVSIFKLIQRKYRPEILKAINVSYAQGLDDARSLGCFSQRSIDDTLSLLNQLSNSINSDFR